MKQIQFNNKKYNCPESWDDITLEMQIKVTADEEHFKTDTTKRIALISGYLGIDPEEMRKASVHKVAPLFKYVKFIADPIPENVVSEFDFQGEHYYVGQNIVEQEFQDFVSLENIMNDTKGNVTESLPYIIAILSKRKKDNGELESMDDYDVELRAKQFRQLPISIANGLAVFFYASANLSTVITQLSSNPEKAVLLKVEEVNNTLSKQAGRGLLMKLQIGLLKSYLKFIKRSAQTSYTGTQQKSFSTRWKQIYKKLFTRKNSL